MDSWWLRQFAQILGLRQRHPNSWRRDGAGLKRQPAPGAGQAHPFMHPHASQHVFSPLNTTQIGSHRFRRVEWAVAWCIWYMASQLNATQSLDLTRWHVHNSKLLFPIASYSHLTTTSFSIHWWSPSLRSLSKRNFYCLVCNVSRSCILWMLWLYIGNFGSCIQYKCQEVVDISGNMLWYGKLQFISKMVSTGIQYSKRNKIS